MRKENKEPVRSGLKKLLGFVYTEFGQTASYKQKKGAVLCKNKRIKSRLYTQMVAIHDMPLRSLLYIGRTYEQLVPVRERYRKGMVKLPMPEFYIFYNGTEKLKQQDAKTLKKWLRFAVMADNIGQFENAISE